MPSKISSISCRFVLWVASFLAKYGCSLKVKNIWPPKIFGLAALLPAGLFRNNISMISVFTLRSTLIVNSKIIKGKLSNSLISGVCITLAALGVNPHARSSSQLQEGWWSLLCGNCLYWCKYVRDVDGATQWSKATVPDRRSDSLRLPVLSLLCAWILISSCWPTDIRLFDYYRKRGLGPDQSS